MNDMNSGNNTVLADAACFGAGPDLGIEKELFS